MSALAVGIVYLLPSQVRKAGHWALRFFEGRRTIRRYNADMRKQLGYWFRKPEEEERSLWQTGLFSFDASVLLNIYAYSNETRDELIKLIEAYADRVRLPYQFGLEYSRNRATVIIKQVNNYLKADKDLHDFQTKHLEPKREHPHLSNESVEAIKGVRDDLSSRRKEMESFISTDPFADRVLNVFEGKLGPIPAEEELRQLHTDAAARYDKNCPPGYADLKDKGTPDAYGDYIGWSQLIEIAKLEQKGFVLVIDDLKEDWWLIEKDRTIGPRPELIDEFLRLTKQQIWIYTSENFLRAAKMFTDAKIRDEAIEEVTQRLASQRESANIADLKPGLDEPKSLSSMNGGPESQKPTGGSVLSSSFTSGDSAKPTTSDEEE